MAEIYIALVDTPGLFASMIRKYLRQKYIHVVISMDKDLEEAYSVGRRNPFVPIIAGFEKEDKNKIFRAFPHADYMVCKINVDEQQKNNIIKQLQADYQSRFRYHYAVIGLIPIVCGKAFYQKNHYTCSSYVAKLLQDNGIKEFDKHFSLVTPKDFYIHYSKNKIFEGKLKELIDYGPEAVKGYGAAYEG